MKLPESEQNSRIFDDDNYRTIGIVFTIN